MTPEFPHWRSLRHDRKPLSNWYSNTLTDLLFSSSLLSLIQPTYNCWISDLECKDLASFSLDEYFLWLTPVLWTLFSKASCDHRVKQKPHGLEVQTVPKLTFPSSPPLCSGSSLSSSQPWSSPCGRHGVLASRSAIAHSQNVLPPFLGLLKSYLFLDPVHIQILIISPTLSSFPPSHSE